MTAVNDNSKDYNWNNDMFLKAMEIATEVEKICKESVEQILKAALPPEMAIIATAKTFDIAEEQKKREEEALDAARTGEGPLPFDREWYQHQYGIGDLVQLFHNCGVGWHLAKDLDELMTWAMRSAEGQRALAMMNEPRNPRQHPLKLLLDLGEALSAYRRDLLVEDAGRLGWDPDRIGELT